MIILNSYSWRAKFLVAISVTVLGSYWQQSHVKTQTVPSYVLPDDTYSQDIYKLAKSTTVRLVRDNAGGSGVIIHQEGQIYTVLTNWHVVKDELPLSILTADGQTYPARESPQQLGKLDLAVVRFQSSNSYQVATIAHEISQIGEKVYVAGFPLYHDNAADTLSQGIQAFRLTRGEISLVPPKSLPEGYHFGYTNDTEIGMSGGPIFNTQGFLIGVHGRGKYRDPDFGAYVFEDGSEPPPKMLEKMVNSSWGIPITSYLQIASQASPN